MLGAYILVKLTKVFFFFQDWEKLFLAPTYIGASPPTLSSEDGNRSSLKMLCSFRNK